MPETELPKWMAVADIGTIADLTLEDGESFTAEVRDFKEEMEELIVDIVPANRSHPNNHPRSRAVPIRRVVSFDPQQRALQPWPYSDPCRRTSFSLPRFALMATLFLCLICWSLAAILPPHEVALRIAGGIGDRLYTLRAVLHIRPHRNQIRKRCSAFHVHLLCHSSSAFSSALAPYRFSRLVFTLQTLAFAVRPNLPNLVEYR